MPRPCPQTTPPTPGHAPSRFPAPAPRCGPRPAPLFRPRRRRAQAAGDVRRPRKGGGRGPGAAGSPRSRPVPSRARCPRCPPGAPRCRCRYRRHDARRLLRVHLHRLRARAEPLPLHHRPRPAAHHHPHRRGVLLAGVAAAVLPHLVHRGEGQRPARRGAAEGAADLRGDVLGAAAGGLPLPLLQAAQEGHRGAGGPQRGRLLPHLHPANGIRGWRGLWAHERRLLHDQPPGGRAGTGHRGHPRGLAALLPDLSLHDHGVDLPAHLLGHPLFPRLREPALVGDRGRRRHAPCSVGVDVLEPAVRGQPGALLPADGRCCCLGLPALGGLCPEPAPLPALFTERSQPPAGILRPRRTLPSPPAPALPSVSAARSALASSAIHFLLEWGDPGQPRRGRYHRPAAAPSGQVALGLACSSAPLGTAQPAGLGFAGPELSCLGRILPRTDPKEPRRFSPRRRRCPVVPCAAGGHPGWRKQLCKALSGPGLNAVVLLSPPLHSLLTARRGPSAGLQ